MNIIFPVIFNLISIHLFILEACGNLVSYHVPRITQKKNYKILILENFYN